MKDGKLVAYPWDMPPPYPTNSAILSSSSSSSLSDILAFLPLKKSESLNLYESLRSYFVLKYSESVAKRVEGLLQMLHKLRNQMLRDDLSLPFRRDCLVHYFKCLCMIEPFFPMNASPNPPIFVWYNAINPQQNSSQHNIHLEKASVLFNLAALCTHVSLSCDQSTIQGHRLAMDALTEASHWFSLLWKFESRKASGTIDLAEQYIHMITNQFGGLKLKFCDLQSYESSLPGHVASAYNPLTSELLGYDPSDVTEQFF
ncbi:vacuolar-sorting protein BRO1-like [Arachis duranensis]|uniref:Vacuolar-sorting protein BRO1-like n=1 Tax=Arachis duranensis TaxID=130453 RepID=A0A9C6TXX3_ARADU|nr:vacuolar-sorting protein BRO1-like [Arachis duranensis]